MGIRFTGTRKITIRFQAAKSKQAFILHSAWGYAGTANSKNETV